MTEPQRPIGEESMDAHARHRGKISLNVKMPIKSRQDLSLAYTPGVAAVSTAIHEQPERVWELTNRGNWVAVVTDGSAVLGLGNIGPLAGLPVMEGKAALFKTLADVDAFPICLNTQDTEEIISIVKALEPSFAGVNLEDISAPRCFEIERRLQEAMSIPVFHDDQHGTAIVVLAGMINALKLTERSFPKARFVVSGAGAAGTAVSKMLLSYGAHNVIVCDSKGVLSSSRTDLNEEKKQLLALTNPENVSGTLADAVRGSDVFVGVSVAGLLTFDMVKTMNKNPIVFAMANPVPEIMPEEAKRAGAAVVASGRSDYPNQVNNVLAFPGIFRGAIDVRARSITEKMQLAAAEALARCVATPSVDRILPDPLDASVAVAVASAVSAAWQSE